jgi:hypothetical protein
VIELIGEVYRVDALAKARKLSDEDRLLLHKERSGPIMDSLRQWLEKQLTEGLTEPNSSLGGAIKYMLKRWEPLTRFLTVPGVPLDNTPCERILKAAIRHRKNSLFFKTKKGARVGDVFMSLLETCALNHVDKTHYLTTVLSNIESVRTSPGSWMPWNYQAMVSSEATATDDQKPEATRQRVAGETVTDSDANPQVTDQDVLVDGPGDVTGAQGSTGHGDGSRIPHTPKPINPARSVETQISPVPGHPGSFDRATMFPGPPRPCPAHRGRLEEARSPT